MRHRCWLQEAADSRRPCCWVHSKAVATLPHTSLSSLAWLQELIGAVKVEMKVEIKVEMKVEMKVRVKVRVEERVRVRARVRKRVIKTNRENNMKSILFIVNFWLTQTAPSFYNDTAIS